jgi:hypothetical protein
MTDKKAEPSRQTSETQRVVDLLTSILNDVQNRAQSQTPKPLEGDVLRAVERFREIGASLELKPRPTITLTATPTPNPLPVQGGTVKLEWSSTEAQTVSIDQKETVGGVPKSLGEDLRPVGSIDNISVSTTTIFTATAKGLCSSQPDTETVEVPVVVIP